MPENDQNKTLLNPCSKSEDGKHIWEVRLQSPGHHGEKRLVEIFICKNCGIKKPIN